MAAPHKTAPAIDFITLPPDGVTISTAKRLIHFGDVFRSWQTQPLAYFDRLSRYAKLFCGLLGRDPSGGK